LLSAIRVKAFLSKRQQRQGQGQGQGQGDGRGKGKARQGKGKPRQGSYFCRIWPRQAPDPFSWLTINRKSGPLFAALA